ncbi:MAG: hypothetical protein AB1505_25525 [Candidatus Latescibacterota bacterium]
MEVKLDNLIEKIRKEGIEEAQQTSEQVVARAKQEAQAILAEARREAERIVEEARRQAAQAEANGRLALQQAARDAELLLKQRIDALFCRVFGKKVAGVMGPEFLKDLILRLTQEWGRGGELEVAVGPGDREKLEQLLFAGLREEMKATISLTVSNRVASGFRIGMRGEDAYYDFTDETIALVLKSFLSPTLKQYLDGKNG